jgi:hypothetical protein
VLVLQSLDLLHGHASGGGALADDLVYSEEVAVELGR